MCLIKWFHGVHCRPVAQVLCFFYTAQCHYTAFGHTPKETEELQFGFHPLYSLYHLKPFHILM